MELRDDFELTQQEIYPEELLNKKQEAAQEAKLDMSYAGLRVAVEHIDQLSNEEYALERRKGFGASDSSVILGVNPFKTLQELIKEKASDTLSEEEKKIGELSSVRKGLDLEPLIIKKHQEYFGYPVMKPVDMYRSEEHPYLVINFDGVAGEPEGYFPVEIKVATYRGIKHYNPTKAIFNEFEGFQEPQKDITRNNLSIESKAAHYGIPVYYYTQLQQQMFGTGAMTGLLSVLFETDWTVHTFLVHRDDRVITELIVKGFQAWKQVVALNPEREIIYES